MSGDGRPTLAEVRAAVRTWTPERQFAWAERAAIVAEGCGVDMAEAEVRAWEQMERRQLAMMFE